MKKSKRMQPVRRVKQQHEQELAKQFGQAQQAYLNEQQQLTMLRQYREDYLTSLRDPAAHGLSSAQQLQKYQQFVLRLEKAITNQQEMVVLKEQAVEAARQAWAQANAQLQALDGLIGRMRDEEARQMDKREQRTLDDLPRRRWDS